MTLDLTPDWDFAHQRGETEATLAELTKEAGLTASARITLDLTFVPGHAEAAPEPLIKALGAFGYLASVGEDGAVEASVLDIPFALPDIWTQEERASRIALARGYLPDGWGFWEP